MDNKRLFTLDFIRVVAVFCIIWCHTNNIVYDYQLFEKCKWFLGKCGVPLFFIISGYLAFPFKGSLKSFLMKKWKRIVIPFITWVTIYMIVAWDKGFPIFEKDLLNNASAHLWFIYVILGLYMIVPIISPFLEQTSKKIIKFYLLMWVMTSIYPLLFSTTDIGLNEHTFTYTLYHFYGYVGFFILGYYFRKYPETRLLRLSTALCLFVLSVLSIWVYFFVFDCTTVVTSDYKGLPIIMYSISAYSILLHISRYIKAPSLRKLTTSLSVNSFGIYLIHMLVIFYIYPFIPVIECLPDLLKTAYFVFINITLSYIIVFFIRKTIISKYLFG